MITIRLDAADSPSGTVRLLGGVRTGLGIGGSSGRSDRVLFGAGRRANDVS